MDFGIPIANGASIAVLVLVLGAMFKLVANANRREREHSRDMDIMDYRLETQELETRHCQQNFLTLAGTCAKGGMEIDRELWSQAPLPTRRDPRLSSVPKEEKGTKP
jgi:hypothetical protein